MIVNHELDKLMLRAEVKDLTVGLRTAGKPYPVDGKKGSPVRDKVIGIVVRYAASGKIKFTQDVVDEDIEKAAYLAGRRTFA